MADIENNNISKMDDSLVTNDIIDLLKKHLNEDGISDYKIEISPGSIRGDNYLGIIAKATVNGLDKNKKQKNLNFIIKCAPKAEGFRKLAPIRTAYEREIFMYNTVLPTFMNFQSKRNIKTPFKSFAKCLKTSFVEKDEALIMVDKKAEGFIMQNRHIPLNYHHVKMVVHEIARLHSFSFAMKDQESELFEELSKTVVKNFFDEMDKEQFDKHSDMVYDKARASLDPVMDSEALRRYNLYCEGIQDDMYDLLSAKAAGKDAVIRHGDCWTNNFLFKYETDDHTKPSEICLLDWQLSCLGSPSLDLLYFIYSCSSKKTLDEEFDNLIKYYHDTLKDFTSQLGSDIEKMFTYEELLEHMQKFGKYGLAIATMLLHLMTSESDEVPNMSEVFEETDNVVEAFMFSSKNQDYYHQRIKAVIYHQIEKNYI